MDQLPHGLSVCADPLRNFHCRKLVTNVEPFKLLAGYKVGEPVHDAASDITQPTHLYKFTLLRLDLRTGRFADRVRPRRSFLPDFRIVGASFTGIHESFSAICR